MKRRQDHPLCGKPAPLSPEAVCVRDEGHHGDCIRRVPKRRAGRPVVAYPGPSPATSVPRTRRVAVVRSSRERPYVVRYERASGLRIHAQALRRYGAALSLAGVLMDVEDARVGDRILITGDGLTLTFTFGLISNWLPSAVT